ncbi:ABC transporter permease [Paenarthrobacter nitroguajacolicus]
MNLDQQLRESLKAPRLVIILFTTIVAVYLLTPMLIVAPASFTAGEYLQVPPDGLSLRWYEAVLARPAWSDALMVSLQISGTGAAVATIVATLAVVGLSRSRKAARWLRPVFFLPMVVPIIVLALGMGRAASALNATSSLWPLALGQAVLCIPLAFITISAGMSKIDPALARAARSMGSSWWRTLWTIELPLLRRSIITGLLLALAYGFDEVVLALFLAPPGQTTVPAKLYTEATQAISPLLASVSVYITLLTLLGAVIFFAASRFTRRRAEIATHLKHQTNPEKS